MSRLRAVLKWLLALAAAGWLLARLLAFDGPIAEGAEGMGHSEQAVNMLTCR